VRDRLRAVLPALVVFRAVYYLGPFMVAVALLGPTSCGSAARAARVLLLSGGMPAMKSRLAWIEKWRPHGA
jgi:hypothetical protein